MILRQAPASNEALREALYSGSIFLLPPSVASRAFVDGVEALLTAELAGDPRTGHERVDPAALFASVGRLRRRVFLDPAFHDRLRAVLAALGFALGEVAFDPARLRAVLHRGHENPRARTAYLAHRDTWYANPDAVITCWIPHADLDEDETFVFYPDGFARPLPNDSAEFDYRTWAGADWARKIGWQKTESGTSAPYPSAAPTGLTPLGFACRRAELLLFAGAHLHRTLPIQSGRIRYNLDFRIVHLADAARGRGAPNVDNRSGGDSLEDYVHPGRPWAPPA